mmetsp:Transcript_50455/g.141206  ORF Transcript_50455/g.141206 Transcript_50455/m.141206 type:complete len:200 (+) Transcript_50455:1080-1679(+)
MASVLPSLLGESFASSHGEPARDSLKAGTGAAVRRALSLAAARDLMSAASLVSSSRPANRSSLLDGSLVLPPSLGASARKAWSLAAARDLISAASVRGLFATTWASVPDETLVVASSRAAWKLDGPTAFESDRVVSAMWAPWSRPPAVAILQGGVASAAASNKACAMSRTQARQTRWENDGGGELASGHASPEGQIPLP